jgi:N-acetylneuraminate synthase
MTLDSDLDDFQIFEDSNLWKGNSLYKLYQKAYTPWEWHQALFEKANSLGLIAFSSPFDITAVDFLETLNVPCYKIASFENNDIPLIKRIAQTGKPVIISTGMASLAEISEAVSTLKENGCSQIILLKCTSAYPASPAQANLKTIQHLRETFQCEVGISDHTLGIGVALAGVALGASVIEKHFVLSRDAGGVDAAFSLEPNELKSLVIESRSAALAGGSILYGGDSSEQDSKKYRRSIYISKNIQAGEVLSADNIKIVRPGLGLAPKHYDSVIGQKIAHDVNKGTALSWELLKNG